MKHLLKVAVFAALALSTHTAGAQGVAVNNTGTSADTSAILDVSATDKGFLPPRMSMGQRDAIVNAANGLVIYQTDNTTGLYYNAGSPGSPSWILAGAAAPFSYGFFYTNFDEGLSPGTNYVYGLSSTYTSNMFPDIDGADILNAGLYHVTFSIHVTSTDATTFVGAVTVNGSPVYYKDMHVDAAGYATVTGETVVQITSFSEIGLQVIINSGELGVSLATETGSSSGITVHPTELNIQQIQ